MCVIFHARQRGNDIVLPCIMFVWHVYCFNRENPKVIFFIASALLYLLSGTVSKSNREIFTCGFTLKFLFDLIFCNNNIFLMKAGYLYRIRVWYLSKAAIS